jgi:hypothetical protein
MTTLRLQQFDRRAVSALDAVAHATDYSRLSVFPGRP